jgi:alpha-glucosidase
MGPDHAALAVDRQDADADSLLNLTRRLVALRQSSPALMSGNMEIVSAGDALLVFEREGEGQAMICAFNLGAEALAWAPQDAHRFRVAATVNGGSVTALPPYAGVILERIA